MLYSRERLARADLDEAARLGYSPESAIEALAQVVKN